MRPVAVWFQVLAPLSEPLLLKSSAVVISDGDRSRRLCLRSEFHPATRNRRKERLYVACQRLHRRRGKAPIGREVSGTNAMLGDEPPPVTLNGDGGHATPHIAHTHGRHHRSTRHRV